MGIRGSVFHSDIGIDVFVLLFRTPCIDCGCICNVLDDLRLYIHPESLLVTSYSCTETKWNGNSLTVKRAYRDSWAPLTTIINVLLLWSPPLHLSCKKFILTFRAAVLLQGVLVWYLCFILTIAMTTRLIYSCNNNLKVVDCSFTIVFFQRRLCVISFMTFHPLSVTILMFVLLSILDQMKIRNEFL